MSLIAWFPFNGDYKNYGSGKGTATGTPVWVDGGKYSKSLNCTGGIKATIKIPEMIESKCWSFAFWGKAYSDANSTKDWNQLIQFSTIKADGTSSANLRIESTYNFNPRAFSFHNNSPFSISEGSAILGKEKDTWYHIVLTYNGTEFKTYSNGTLISKTTGLGGYFTGTITIGSANFQGEINDLRIYDNILTEAEIREIYKTPIRKFSFKNLNGTNTNLCQAAARYTVSSPFSFTSTAADAHTTIKDTFCKVNGGKKYVLSVSTTDNMQLSQAHGATAINTGTTTNAAAARPFTFWLYFRKVGTEKAQYDFDSYICFTSQNNSHYSRGKRHFWIFTAPADAQDACVRVNTYSDGETSKTIKFFNIKLERVEDAKDTPWQKNDYTSTTFVDESGLGTDATFVAGTGDETFDYSCPVGESGVILDNQRSQYIDLNGIYLPQDAYTINVWFKIGSVKNYQRIFEFANVLSGGAGNKRILLTEFGTTDNIQYHAVDANGTSYSGSPNILTRDSNWHMATIVTTLTGTTWYVDGVKKGTKAGTLTNDDIGGNRQYAYLGKSSYSADAYFDGVIGEFDLYAAPFTDDMVRQQYQAKIKVDKNGTVFTKEIDVKDDTNLLGATTFTTSLANLNGSKCEATIQDQPLAEDGTMMYIKCTTAGTGFYFNSLWGAARNKMIEGHRYELSFWAKSSNRTNLKMNIECSNGQDSTNHPISTEWTHIKHKFVYGHQQYSALTLYGNYKVDEDLYMYDFKLREITLGNNAPRLESNGTLMVNNGYENYLFPNMKTKVLDDGSVWARIFYHNIKNGTVLFTTNNVLDIDEANRYSKLKYIELYRNQDDNKFEFLLDYPLYSATQYNRWKQSDNPCTVTITNGDENTFIGGYEAIHIDWTAQYWGGLNKSTISNCFINGSVGHGNWFYAIGQNTLQGYDGKSIPGPDAPAQDTELWVRIDNLKNHNFKIYKDFIQTNEIYEI